MGQVLFDMPEIQEECKKLNTVAKYKSPTLYPQKFAPPERQRYIAVAEHIGWLLLWKMAEQSDAQDEIVD